MKRRSYTAYLQPEALAARTGEHCPETGWWYPARTGADEATPPARFLSEGSVMPAVGAAAGSWLLGAPQPRPSALREPAG